MNLRPKRKRSLFGSARGRTFREARSRWRGNRKREQRVRFRRRAATSTLKSVGRTVWLLAQGAFLLGVVAVGVAAGARFWRTHQILRVTNVAFEGDVPPTLAASFPVRNGMNLLSVHPAALSTEALSRFPELQALAISRGLRGTVKVAGHYRTAVAIAGGTNPLSGVDKDSVVFPFPPGVTPDASLPRIAAVTAEGRRDALEALRRWREKLPAFSSLIKEIETDKLRAARVTLSNGVTIEWGMLQADEVVDRARHVARLLEEFTPRTVPASLRFVDTDRIVMDAKWVRQGLEQQGGNPRGKT